MDIGQKLSKKAKKRNLVLANPILQIFIPCGRTRLSELPKKTYNFHHIATRCHHVVVSACNFCCGVIANSRCACSYTVVAASGISQV
jgi:hypothetical protein